MARIGNGIYDSDGSFDALAEITQFLIKEVVYWFAPEQISHNASWLREVLTLVEIMLIFAEEKDYSSIHLMGQETAIKRWQEIFFGVWDAEWNGVRENDSPYSASAYRIEHRQLVSNLFDHLNELAEDWRDDLPACDLEPFALEGKLPYFSITRLKTQDHREFFLVGSFLYTLIHHLTRKIIFVLSEENTEKEWGFDFFELEEVWVAVDVMGRLCEKYQVSPGLRPRTIHGWLDKMIGFWIEQRSAYGLEDPTDAQTLANKGGLYTNVVTAFVRLITLAQKFPGGMAL